MVARSVSESNVIQSGGEDGMWNFDRYQRWMEQKKDWVRSDSLAGGDGPLTTGPRATAPVPAPAPARGTPPPDAPASSPERGSITVEEVMDIEELADLARQVEKRTR